MSEPAVGASPRVSWSLWLERLSWVGLGAFFLSRCVLPGGGEPPGAELATVRLATVGRPVLVVFDGSR